MDAILWIAQVVLAAAFFASGTVKLVLSHAELAEMGETMQWVEDFRPRHVKAIGALEVLGAGGLILPAALDVAPVLTPIAAVGLGLTMLGAAATHFRRGELQVLPVNASLLAIATLVAIERFGPQALSEGRVVQRPGRGSGHARCVYSPAER